MKKLVIGILAHVDAGKTTLSESMLYTSGSIRHLGRVDNKDAYLDNNAMERERGITIFSKQAEFSWKDMAINWIHRGMWTFLRRWSGPLKCLIMQCWSSAERMVCRDIPERCGVC